MTCVRVRVPACKESNERRIERVMDRLELHNVESPSYREKLSMWRWSYPYSFECKRQLHVGQSPVIELGHKTADEFKFGQNFQVL